MAEAIEILSGPQIAELAERREALGIATDSPTPEAAREYLRSSAENPAGANVHAVVRVDGSIVAAASYVPKMYVRSGRAVLVGEIGGTYTAAEAQGRGYFSRLVGTIVDHARESDVLALYGTPNEQSGAIYINKLGWTPVQHWTRWLGPSWNPAIAVQAAKARIRGHLHLDTHDPQLAEIGDVDASRALRDHVERTHAQITWRYPADRYRMVTARYGDGSIAGWAVFGETTRLGRSAISVADLALPERGAGVMAAMFARSLTSFRGRRLLFGATFRGGHFKAWRHNGFLARKSPMPLIAFAAADPAGHRMFDKMVFDIGDSDTV